MFSLKDFFNTYPMVPTFSLSGIVGYPFTQEKKLKNCKYLKKSSKKSDDNDGGKLDIMKTQATVLQYYRMNGRNNR